MRAKEIILSDLESDINKNKLEPVDRWIINDNGKQISVQIENCIGEQVIYTPPFDKSEDITLINFIERYCTSVELIEKKVDKYYYESRSLLKRVKIKDGIEGDIEEVSNIIPVSGGIIQTWIGDLLFKYTLPFDQQCYNTVALYSNILGEEIHIMDCKFIDDDESQDISVYFGNGFIISFNKKIISINYLFGYNDTITKQFLNTAFYIDQPDYITMQDYGIKYIDNIKIDHHKWQKWTNDTDNLTFDLTLYNNQKNKEFTKGLVALPFMMSSIGISIQSEMFIPMRRTEIKDDETRVVYNYLYRL